MMTSKNLQLKLQSLNHQLLLSNLQHPNHLKLNCQIYPSQKLVVTGAEEAHDLVEAVVLHLVEDEVLALVEDEVLALVEDEVTDSAGAVVLEEAVDLGVVVRISIVKTKSIIYNNAYFFILNFSLSKIKSVKLT